MIARRYGFLALVLLAAGFAADAAAPQGLEGFWQGALQVQGTSLRLAFKIRQAPDGALAGTLDSIDQGAKDIPLSDVHLQDRSVRFEVKIISGVFEGMLAASGDEIVGEWKQGGATFPLTLKRVETIAELKRPQDPVKPYPYNEEEVLYESGSDGGKLAGTLTWPRTGGPFPAVLLITGSGLQDRNETVMGHRPFLVLADALTRRGIAVLRVDDRGVGGSTGDPRRATTQDLAGDVLAGVAFLKTRKEIDPAKIGLIGHSEGGIIAPNCAVRSRDVAFIVLMAGTGVTGEEILYRQSALILKASGADRKKIAQNRKAQEQMFALIKEKVDGAELEKSLREIYDRLLAPAAADPSQAAASEKEQPARSGASPAASGDATQKPAAEALAAQQVKMMTSPWFRYFLTYDPRSALKQVACPVLAINGARDLQVPAKENLRAIRRALREGGNRDVTIKSFPKLNHLFQTSRTGSPAEYAQIEETIAPAVLTFIGDWIVRHTQLPGAGSGAGSSS